ncbi:MAG: hypothetical protein QOD99_1864 [Chthoniobacter sp.]|nr:hypothetical protein [Chthoniobacter sp.]
MSRAVALAFLACFALSGCDQIFQNPATRALSAGEQKEKAGDYNAAIQSYEAALDGSPKSADVHYRLALIYDEKIKDPVSATHHFQRYLALASRGPHAKDARRFIDEDQLKIATAFSKGAFMTQQDAVHLKKENDDLRGQVARLQAPKIASMPGNVSAKKTPPAGAKTYTVQSGDTLAKISRQYFKTAARAKDIQDANHNLLAGTTKLKPGMVLLIPAK